MGKCLLIFIEMEKKNINAPQCRAKLNAMEDALFVIGGKWKMRIILALDEKPLRFNELQRTISGISAKVLSGELKDLEQNGFLRRNIIMGNPIVVEYELLPYSRTLDHVLEALISWGSNHRKQLMATPSLN